MPNYKDASHNLHYLDDAAFVHLLSEGCVEITEAEAAAIRQSKIPAWSCAPLLRIARAGREIALNRLAGIAFAAKESNDSATVTACLSARTALLNITTLPSVLAATDDASLTAAVGAEYASIVAACPANIRAAFAGIQS
jgi:hypothetical protein